MQHSAHSPPALSRHCLKQISKSGLAQAPQTLSDCWTQDQLLYKGAPWCCPTWRVFASAGSRTAKGTHGKSKGKAALLCSVAQAAKPCC